MVNFRFCNFTSVKKTKTNIMKTAQEKLNNILNNLTKGLADTRKEESWSESFNKSVKKVLNIKRKSNVFKKAWELVKQEGKSLSEALKLSWALN